MKTHFPVLLCKQRFQLDMIFLATYLEIGYFQDPGHDQNLKLVGAETYKYLRMLETASSSGTNAVAHS